MATAAEQRAWLDGLENSWRRELSASRHAVEEIWNTPLLERIRDGHSLGPLRTVKISSDRVIMAPVHENEPAECRLREGDFVCLSRDTPWAPLGHFIHLGEDDSGIHLHLWKGSLPPQECNDWVLDRDHVDLTDRFQAAMDALAGTSLGRERILPVLLGDTANASDGDTFLSAMDELESPANDPLWQAAQREAIDACLATRDAWLVQGPPGTGKTHVLAEVVRRLVASGERVLVTGPTHRAIGHALDGCRKIITADTRIAKIGPAMLAPETVETFETYAASGLLDSSDPHVIGATPFALWSAYTGLREAEFDTVIIEEASQVTTMVAIMAMLRGERWLFFGDDCQLPPVVLAAHEIPARERSIFTLLKNRGFDTMLEETWRLNQELAAWPSATFYRNRLICRHDRRLTPSPLPTHPALAIPESTVLIVDGGSGGTVRSDGEAQTAADLVRALIASGLAPDDIGVVTPYRAQAARIRQILRIHCETPGLDRRVVVDTVERFQGRERDAILITLASSKPEWIHRMADFLFQRERWNVAVTRARRKVVVIASQALLDTAESLANDGHAGAACFSSWCRHLSPGAIIRV